MIAFLFENIEQCVEYDVLRCSLKQWIIKE